MAVTMRPGWRSTSTTYHGFPSQQRTAFPPKSERIEYDPNRSAHIASVICRWRSAATSSPRAFGNRPALIAAPRTPIKPGNAPADPQHPGRPTIHRIEMVPGRAPTRARRRHFAAARSRRLVCPSCACAWRDPPPFEAAPPSVKSVTASMVCARSARQWCEPLARYPPDRSRRGDEPGGSPAWWRRRPYRRGARTGQSVGTPAMALVGRV